MQIHELLNSNKKYLKGKKALIFDMDGTLIDSMSYWCYTAGEDITKYPSQIEYLFEKYNNDILPKKGAMELLSLLHENNIPVCIASDTPRKLSEGFFKRFDFDSVIDFYLGSDDVGVYKSQRPDIYFKAAKKMGVKPEECLVFEDNLSSVLSAATAGFDVVGVYDKENAQNYQRIKTASVDYINDLTEMLK